MIFLWPAMLLTLLAIPLLVALYTRYQQRRRRLAGNLGSLGKQLNAFNQSPGKRQHIPPLIFLSGLGILMIAMARPQASVRLPRVEGTVVIVFDVSGSMAATDIQPSRLEAAKTAAREFINRQPASVKVGVVAFSDGGFSIQAPSNRSDEIIRSIERMSPQRGTSLGQGILAALNTIAISYGQPALDLDLSQTNPDGGGTLQIQPTTFGPFQSAMIVLVSDGENTSPPDPIEAARFAFDAGVRIYTVGIGSPGGATLDIDGFSVHTRLDETSLKQISQITGGKYFPAASVEDLYTVYQELGSQLVIKPEKIEITALLAGASLFMMITGGFLSLLWFSRIP